MLSILKNFYNNENNFKYDCLCSTFNVKRKYDGDTKSYVDTINYDYSECSETHISHTKLRDDYGLNSINLRSDELKVVKDGTHILFGGCSQTWGYGIDNKEDLWSHIVNQSFSDSSGYFNLARSGWNTSQIVADAIAYCNTYGIPKYMFLVFPDYERETVNFRMNQDDVKPIDKDYILMLQQRTMFLAIMAIEGFCKANNIKLVYSTWHGLTTHFLARLKLENFITLWDVHNLLIEPNLFFFTDLQNDGHWAEKHHKRFAEIVLEKIK
jgi:hypothetical protein